MKTKQLFFLVVAALAGGGIAGYGSSRLADRSSDRTIVAVRELRFLDSAGNEQVTLEPGEGPKPSLVLKDSTGNLLYDLPPSFKILPADGS